MRSSRRRAGERSPSASGPDGSSVELACIDRQYGAHQYVHSVCDVCRGCVFARRMANTAHTWHENHSDRSDAGNVLGVMPGAARHGHRRQPEPVRLAGDDTLDAWIGQCGYRGRFEVPKLDASATNRGDLPGARAYPLEHGLDPCRIEIPHFDAEYRSEEHTSELQSPCNLVCRLLLEKKKTTEVMLTMIITCVNV